MSLDNPGFEGEESAVAKIALLRKCEQWEKDGISTFTCEYSGVDGVGDFDFFRFTNGHTEFTEQDTLSPSCADIYEALESLAFAEVSTMEEGGGGQITVDVRARRITRTEYYFEPTKVNVSQEVEI